MNQAFVNVERKLVISFLNHVILAPQRNGDFKKGVNSISVSQPVVKTVFCASPSMLS